MKRRDFLSRATQSVLVLAGPGIEMKPEASPRLTASNTTLFLCGDVMTGRGIDQALPHPGDPRIYEGYVKSALDYVELAETANGPIPRPVPFSYVWGDALAELARAETDARIINLETAITKSEDGAPKSVRYRMHPDNVPCITAAQIDCCALANNHVLDWGVSGLSETLETLHRAGVRTAGAGRHIREAEAPAILEIADRRRVLVFAFGSVSSGIPGEWAASDETPGVALLEDSRDAKIRRLSETIRAAKQPGDVVVASIHWGGNWGYQIPHRQFALAHELIDGAGVDIVHGHSSHHPKGIEVYHGRPILYGCGDFLNDYEGIEGYEAYRDDLVLMYLVSMDVSTGELARLEMIPFQIRRFRLNRASTADTRWMRDTLDRECVELETRVVLNGDDSLMLLWA